MEPTLCKKCHLTSNVFLNLFQTRRLCYFRYFTWYLNRIIFLCNNAMRSQLVSEFPLKLLVLPIICANWQKRQNCVYSRSHRAWSQNPWLSNSISSINWLVSVAAVVSSRYRPDSFLAAFVWLHCFHLFWIIGSLCIAILSSGTRSYSLGQALSRLQVLVVVMASWMSYYEIHSP